MSIKDRILGFVVRYKWALIIAALAYVLAIVFLMLFSSGPQNEPFQYQVS